MTNRLIGRPVLLLVIALVATASQAARAAGSSGVAGSSGLARPSSASSGSLACDSLSCWHEEEVERYRKSFFQGAEVLGGYLGDTGDAAGGLDQSFSEVRASFGIPLGSLDNVIGLRPFFRADFLDGPTAVDLPETLYNTGISILHQAKWSERYSTTVILTPAVRSDFTTSEKAFRLFGLAVVNWKARHDLTLSAGVVYFDRADFSLLPAVGLTWTPTPYWKIDATMPRPRIAHRLWKQGGEAEGWTYLGGAIGGTTWAITRGGVTDELTLRDLRIFGGYEVIRRGNRGFTIEGGYAFDRTIELESVNADVDLDSALFVEAAWRF